MGLRETERLAALLGDPAAEALLARMRSTIGVPVRMLLCNCGKFWVFPADGPLPNPGLGYGLCLRCDGVLMEVPLEKALRRRMN